MNEDAYGLELILDLHGCDVRKFTRGNIEQYFVKLCELIDMKREDLHFWDDEDVPEEGRQTDPKTMGVSAVQFILTSSIVIHALPMLQSAYVNIFSCKKFDVEKADKFTKEWFGAKRRVGRTVVRQ